MNWQIDAVPFSKDAKEKLYEDLGREAIKAKGVNGLSEEPVSFEARENGEYVGSVVVQMFWGQLHVKFLRIEEKYRNCGYATKLMNYAFNYGVC